MATREIKDAKDLTTNELIYFKSHAKATYMSDGATVEDAINSIRAGNGGDIVTETDPIFSASPAAKITEEDIEKWKNNGLKTYVFDAGVFDDEIVSINKTLTQDELNEIVNADFVYVKYKQNEDSDGVFILLESKANEDFFTTYFTSVEHVMGIIWYINLSVSFSELALNFFMESMPKTAAYLNPKSEIFLSDGIYDGMVVDMSNNVLYDDALMYTVNLGTTYNIYTLQRVYNELSNEIFMGEYGDNSILKLTYNKSEPNNSVINIISRGTYSKPSTGIPKSDLASAVQTSLGKADTALQSEQYKGTVTSVKINGATKTPNANGVVDLGTIEGGGGSSSGCAYAEVNHGTNDTTFALTPNTFHVWDEVTSLDLSFADEQAGVANEYLFQFTSGTMATTLTLPDVKWANNSVPTIGANKTYQISILKGLASVLEFKYEKNYPESTEFGFPLYLNTVLDDLSTSGMYRYRQGDELSASLYSWFESMTGEDVSSELLQENQIYIDGNLITSAYVGFGEVGMGFTSNNYGFRYATVDLQVDGNISIYCYN